jgi:hypothetical protein
MIRNLHGVLVALVLVGFCAGVAHGAAVIDLSWDACSPIQHDRVLPAGATMSHLYATGTGITGATVAYQFKIYLGTNFGGTCSPTTVPDAWRFDATGCQGTPFYSVFTNSTSKTCPALSGTSTPVKIIEMNYSPFDIQEVLTVAIAYQNAPQTADPNVTYQLGHILFDHTYAVQGAGDPPNTCGGFEKPMCITAWGGYNVHGDCLGPNQATHGSYLRLDGTEVPFGGGPVDVASFRIDAGIQACNLATPAQPTTWGAIRAQYR